MPKQINHIAIIRLSAMGDVAMTVPVIRALVEQNPQIKVTVVSRPFFKPFFDRIDNVTFFEFDDKKRHKGFLGLLKLYSDLKKLNIDAFADLHNVLRSKVIRNLFAFSGVKTAFTDKGRAEKKELTKAKNKVFKPLKSMVERHLETFKKLGFNIDLTQSYFPKKSILSEKIKNEIGESNSNKLIGIAPFAQYQSKVYPQNLTQEVIKQLAKNKNFKILLFGGGKEEIELLNTFAKGLENVITIAGKLKFKEEIQLISNLDVMLSMDSGNAHIAAMLGVKTITLWGSTHPFAGFAPFHQPSDNCLVSDRKLYPKLPTSIYGNKKVEGYEDAMRTISVENILSAINRNL